jgi:hypothetical protein
MIDKLTPAAFEKHSGRETARKWKNNIWVIINGDKVPLGKTVLLKYYNQVAKAANGSQRSQNGRVGHRDEFVRCTRCNKERRFRLRSKEECRIHHMRSTFYSSTLSLRIKNKSASYAFNVGDLCLIISVTVLRMNLVCTKWHLYLLFFY